MRSSATVKIFIVFLILLVGWFFIRVARLLFPILLIAIVIGLIWDWAYPKKGSDEFDDYEEL
ncbi:hypothetical protein DNU06_13140 [Putridiphycobacter roseus]|uniref:Uncharacterized protein n=1 Tax=Putridiphycobacter roseus TaxID=2219161 RepID=A0A2W1NEJ5_9FLAO|nr:hypothetical protein [Putridiphycobacter roseus]PZE16486.1 hypothetical protein DNU06_13140 [Putridiphycobacter roseus]